MLIAGTREVVRHFFLFTVPSCLAETLRDRKNAALAPT
jgi:hypothetical protein